MRGCVGVGVMEWSIVGRRKRKRLGNLPDRTTHGESEGQSRGALSDGQGRDQVALIAVIVVECVVGPASGHCCCHGGGLSLLLAHASVRCGDGAAARGAGDDIGGSFRVDTDHGADKALIIK